MLKDILYEKIEQRLLAKELDTDKAVVLGRWCASEQPTSLRCDTETLYLSPRGDYFIVYEGGLNASFHSLPGVESWFGGSHIRTVSLEEALEWCEETGNDEALKTHAPFAMLVVERHLAATGRIRA